MKLHIKYQGAYGSSAGHSNYTDVQKLTITDQLEITQVGRDGTVTIPREVVQSIESVEFHNSIDLHLDDSDFLAYMDRLARDLSNDKMHNVAEDIRALVGLTKAIARGAYSSELGAI